jgi:putative hemolysin
MVEIAIVTVKKSHLKKLKNQGNTNAAAALELVENPNRFFSTVQAGITLIGILTGAFSGIALSEPVSLILQDMGMSHGLSDSLGFIFIVVLVTYLSILIGELVPKRVGLNFPEPLALYFALPMLRLAQFFNPIVALLSSSTELIIKILRLNKRHKPAITDDDIRMLIHEGEQMGVFESEEKAIVEKVLNIGDMKVRALMKSRSEVEWIDISASPNEVQRIVLEHPYSHFPICDGGLDSVVGLMRTDTYLAETLNSDKPIDIRSVAQTPLLIPENKKVLEVLELFKRKRVHMGIIIDEYGSLQGIVTLTDILESIVGDIPNVDEVEESYIMKRTDTSWYVDGLITISEFREYFKIKYFPNANDEHFNTIGGFVMSYLGRVPVSGDSIKLDDYTLEVVDMDSNRVDKIVVNKILIE